MYGYKIYFENLEVLVCDVIVQKAFGLGTVV